MTAALRIIGFRREILANPVTWIAAALVALAAAAVVRADRHYDHTCAVIAPVVTGAVYNDEYIVQPHDNLTYEYCLGRIPPAYVYRWPLTDCSPGGRAHFSDGSLAPFPQKCRFDSGNRFLF